MEPVKNCPFCGQEANVIKYRAANDGAWLYAVVCHSCGGMMESPSLNSAIEKWNRRAVELDAVEYSIARDRMCRSIKHNCGKCKLFGMLAGCRIVAEAPISPFAVMYVKNWNAKHPYLTEEEQG